MSGERVLVTGAGGFLGAAVCRRLVADGYRVHGTVRDRPRRRAPEPGAAVEASFHRVELADSRAVARLLAALRPDCIVHCAAHRAGRYGDPLPAIVADDVLATANLVESAGHSRLVHFTTCLLAAAPGRPIADADLLAPIGLRGTTRSAATALVQQAARDGRVRAIVLRPFHVYGPGEPDGRLVPTLLRAALDGRPVRLTRRRPALDLVYVDDVALGCSRAVASRVADGSTVNLASGVGVTADHLVATLERLIGRRLHIDATPFAERPTDAHDRVGTVSTAQSLLGWVATTGLEEGLLATLCWLRGLDSRGGSG